VLLLLVAASLLTVDWGAEVSFVEWLSAMTTAGALIVTGVLLRLETADAHRRRQLEDQAEARLVSAWVRTYRDDPDVDVVVRSRAAEPIYDVRASIHGLDLTYADYANLNEADDRRMGFMADLLPPGTDEQVSFESLNTGSSLSIDLEFTDAAGRHWRRESAGRLCEISQRDYSPCWNPDNDGDLLWW
jgi:hypothetical protein